LFDGERTTIPRASSCRRRSAPLICARAPVRESVRPAPWHVVPKEWSIDPGSPARTKLEHHPSVPLARLVGAELDAVQRHRLHEMARLAPTAADGGA
jgi:hypothetical protein